MNRRPFLLRTVAAAPLWVLAGMLLLAPWSRAEDARPPHRRMENRFLFVIDTSSAMRARTNGVEQAVAGLLGSEMKGELRKGDTIGLWTYSDRLSTDFPMQVWSEEKNDAIVQAVREYLHILVYEKRAHLERAWPAIRQVLADSERLTVFLVFDGSEEIKGTPFDKQINKLHEQFGREFRYTREPFVTVLAARDGVIFNYTDNHPDSVVVPHTADPLPPPETNEPAREVVSPLPEIISPPKPRIQINLTGADFPHHDHTTPPAANSVVTPATPTPTPAPAPVVVTEAPAPAQAPPVEAQTTPAAPAVNTTVAPPQAAPAPTPAPAPAQIPAPAPAPASSSPPSAATATLAPMVAAAAKPVAATPEPTPERGEIVPVATAAVTATSAQPVAMFIIAFSLLTIAVALVVLVVWRWRGRSQPSLITRSIDRSR